MSKKKEMGTYGYGLGSPKNVVDAYRDKLVSEICSDLDARRSPCIIICMNVSGDFNKASIIRASNAFLAQEVIIVGKRRIDRRGAVGTHHYEHISHKEDTSFFADLINQGYTIFPIENVPEFNPQRIDTFELPYKCAFVFGEELLGLSEDLVKQCNGATLYIPQYGSVRSINVAQAAAIALYEYTRQHPDAQSAAPSTLLSKES
ncbi:MAG: TrmH family RNA methyltransferase [Coriobacteriia bacterium]|nr:TrmH family RNA methyltransferase [Coriobacteriia bacterium]